MKPTQAIRLVVEIGQGTSTFLIRVDRHGIAQIVRDGAPFVEEDTHVQDAVNASSRGYGGGQTFRLGVEIVNL